MTQYPDLFAALAAPFRDHEVKARSQGGRQLHYVTARTVQNRLDEVLGPENWWPEFHPWNQNGVLCRLTIKLPDGSTLTKSDVGGYADMQDAGDGEKAGSSDALKRAAVHFGPGRYLYRDGVPEFVRERNLNIQQVEPSRQLAQDQSARPEPPRQQQPNGHSNGNGGCNYGPPRNGRGLFAAIKNLEQEHNVALLKYIDGWAKSQNFPFRMVEWDEQQVAAGYAEAMRKLGQAESQEVAVGAGETDDIPFDLAAAQAALESQVSALAGKLFDIPADQATPDQIMAALGVLDNVVGSDNVVADWSRCDSRAAYRCYYKAAKVALRDYDTSVLQAVLAS